MILITTAGKVGVEAARLLAQRDQSVRALVRNPEKATALRQLGVEVAEGDLEDSASIDAAMQGVTSVVLVSPPVPAQELNVIDSAAHAEVGHVARRPLGHHPALRVSREAVRMNRAPARVSRRASAGRRPRARRPAARPASPGWTNDQSTVWGPPFTIRSNHPCRRARSIDGGAAPCH
jgi:hypothetical protein